MTTYEREIFSKLLDVNWELQTQNHSDIILESLKVHYNKLTDELIDSMGIDEYDKFINQGREMFKDKMQ